MLGLVDGANWAEIFTAIATTAIGLGVVVAIVQLFEDRRTQRGQMAKEVSRRWASPELICARKLVDRFHTPEELQQAVITAYAEQNDDHYLFTTYLNFFEELGVVCQHTIGGVKVVNAVLGSTVLKTWRLWEPIIGQVWHAQPTACEHFRWLYDHLVTYRYWAEMNRIPLT